MFLCSYSILIIQIFSNHKCACSHSVSPDFECFFINCSGVSVCFKEKKKWKTFSNQLWSQKKNFQRRWRREIARRSPFYVIWYQCEIVFTQFFVHVQLFFIFVIQTGFLWGWWVLIGSSFVDNIRSMLKTIWPRNLIFNYIMHCKAKTRLV